MFSASVCIANKQRQTNTKHSMLSSFEGLISKKKFAWEFLVNNGIIRWFNYVQGLNDVFFGGTNAEGLFVHT